MLQLITTPIDALSASASSIREAVEAVKVTPDMVNACGSERSARYAALATALTSKDVDSAYTKACLYASWKEGFKAEKNPLYKSLAELAANCGESRQSFAALAKVGSVFFPTDEKSAAVARKWTERKYSPYTLFDLAGLPYDLLDAISETLKTYGVKPNGESSRISATHARLIKEAYAAVDKDTSRFESLFMTHESGWVDGDTFIDKICSYKLVLADSNGESNDSDSESVNDSDSESGSGDSEKSGFSTYTFIVPHMDRVSEVYSDATESILINFLSDKGYKIIGTETNRRGIVRTFVHEETNDLRVLGVFPLTVKSLAVDVRAYNESVRADMELKGVGKYFHEFTIEEYVRAVAPDVNPVNFLRVEKEA